MKILVHLDEQDLKALERRTAWLTGRLSTRNPSRPGANYDFREKVAMVKVLEAAAKATAPGVCTTGEDDFDDDEIPVLVAECSWRPVR